MKNTRREFLKHTAALGAMTSVPYLWMNRSARGEDVNSKLTIAAIGVGGSRGRYNQGGNIARSAARLGKMIACCDVDDVHAAEFNASFDNKLKTYRDYRVLFEKEKPDVVTIGTPDHWHVAIAIAAMRAGCDVYCEKPLTLTIDEGIQIWKAVEQTGKVFQVGTQQRSSDLFLKAIALVQSGRIGKNINAYIAIGGSPDGGPFPVTSPPKGLDWDLWLGPAPLVGYSDERRKMFRWWYEYSGGKMTDWGAHHIDIALWALGFDKTGPVKISGTCKFPPVVPKGFDWQPFLNGKVTLPDGFNTPAEFHVNLEFGNGATVSVNSTYKRDKDNVDFGNGILFEGNEGRIFVNRGKLEGKAVDALTEADNRELEERIVKIYGGKPVGHMENFFQCVKCREWPVSDVATHHRTMTCCHLSNIALMLGRELHWDPDAQQFVDDEQAAAFMTRARRKPFTLDA